jgi:hypothetical protein
MLGQVFLKKLKTSQTRYCNSLDADLVIRPHKPWIDDHSHPLKAELME